PRPSPTGAPTTGTWRLSAAMATPRAARASSGAPRLGDGNLDPLAHRPAAHGVESAGLRQRQRRLESVTAQIEDHRLVGEAAEGLAPELHAGHAEHPAGGRGRGGGGHLLDKGVIAGAGVAGHRFTSVREPERPNPPW